LRLALSLICGGMDISRIGLAVSLALAANGWAEVVLRLRYTKLFVPFTDAQRQRRVWRWVLCFVSLMALAVFTALSIPQLTLAALFAVTAATDFECKRLPWDWFLYGSVIAGIGVGFVERGWLGFRDAVIAQAILFAAMTLTVIFLRQTAGGDIKLMMQYSAACGHVTTAMLGIVVSGLAMLLISLTYRLITRRTLTKVPLAPATWVGLVGAFLLGGGDAPAFF
jgi:hypothetical protein